MVATGDPCPICIAASGGESEEGGEGGAEAESVEAGGEETGLSLETRAWKKCPALEWRRAGAVGAVGERGGVGDVGVGGERVVRGGMPEVASDPGTIFVCAPASLSSFDFVDVRPKLVLRSEKRRDLGDCFIQLSQSGGYTCADPRRGGMRGGCGGGEGGEEASRMTSRDSIVECGEGGPGGVFTARIAGLGEGSRGRSLSRRRRWAGGRLGWGREGDGAAAR